LETLLFPPFIYDCMTLTPEVRNWVKNQIAAGYSQEQVMTSLRQQGWSKEDLNELFPETKHLAPFIKPKLKPQNQLPKILAIIVLLVIAIGGYQLLFRGEIPEEERLGNVSEEIDIENGVQELEEEQPQQEITEEKVEQPQITQEVIDISQLRTASILEVPMPNSFHCFVRGNENNPECSQYYKEECYKNKCRKELACPRYYNPVCGADGLFYPSACWAEQLGTTVASYGYCDSIKQFISDLWLTKKVLWESFVVPSPNIEFTYTGEYERASGVWLRSTLWESSKDYAILDFNIQSTHGEDWSTSTSQRTTLIPVMDSTPKILLVFVMFDDAYPESVLIDWTETYEVLMNDYIQKKQEVSNPIQYDIVPVVISPPIGIERLSPSHTVFTPEELQKIYDTSLQNLDSQDFDILTISSVVIGGSGGFFQEWENKQVITSPLHPPTAPYSATDKKAGLDSLAAFQKMFWTLSFEVLHALGLPGDHMPMGYGIQYLSPGGQNVDPVTGNKKEEETNPCDFLGTSPDYYAVKIPPEFKILVGQEPIWLNKQESVSGDCLSGLYNNVYLKDYDNDGEYEIMYSNTLIGIELQRSLGWVDVDGDTITELIDADAYGGWKEVEEESKVSGKREIKLPTEIPIAKGQFFSSFEPVEEVILDNCTFERVTLEDNTEGLVPLQCAEFNSHIVNVYKGVKYQWEFVEKEYGTVILPKLA